ncbi:MAG: GntR family transcriptional regulator [Chloroflexi bacterium]|nr:GntR family transcriptional regulator [Chloroflexota bacterium]
MAETVISRAVLSDTVKDRLLEAILDGRYPPGSRIVETRAAREFGTSQAPVREALRDLEALGVVEISPFRGARVRRPSLDELAEAYVVRSELEGLAVRLAVPRLTDEDLEVLSGFMEAMDCAAEAGDTVAEAAADARFHGRLVEIAANGTLARVWGLLEPYSRTYISLAVPGADRRRIAGLHAPVLDALRSRDAATAEAAIRHHFADAEEMLARLWTEPESGETTTQPPARAPRARTGPVPART